MKLKINIFFLAIILSLSLQAENQKVFLHWKGIEIWNADGKENSVLGCQDAEYRDDSGIPVFSKEIETNTVLVDSLTFTDCTQSETELILQSGVSFSDTVQYTVETRTERKVKHYFLQILPIIKQRGVYKKLTSFCCTQKPLSSITLKKSSSITPNAFYSAPSSVLSRGKWSKIKIKETGIYRLTASDLKSMGVTAQNVRIFGYGGAMLPEKLTGTIPEDLPELAIFRGTDYVLFYAKGVVSWSYSASDALFKHTINPYSDAGYYFVTSDVGVGKTIVLGEQETAFSKEVSAFTDYLLHEKNEVNLLLSGREFYGEKFSAVRAYTFYFEVPNPLNEQASLRLNVISSSPTEALFSVKVNGTSIGGCSVKPLSSSSSYRIAEDTTKIFKFTPSFQTPFSVSLTYNKPVSSSVGYLNYIELNVRRALKMSGTSLFFRDPSNATDYSLYNCKYNLSNALPAIKVWDVTASNNVFEVPTTFTGSTLSFVAENYPLHEYVALYPKGVYPSPEIVGKVKNQNLHGLSQCDMVIIAHSEFLSEARRLADAHNQISGLKVHVVSADEVYNEFSSGTPDATAYRRLMKMFYDRAISDAEMPKYLLLFGDGHYDNKGIATKDLSTHRLLTYQSENSIYEMSSFVSDDYFALLDDGEGASVISESMDIGVGRFPVSTLEQAKAVVDKTIFYMNDTHKGAWKTKICFVADDGDRNQHMEEADSIAIKTSDRDNNYLIKKIYLDAYKQEKTASGEFYPAAHRQFVNLLKSGVLMVNYTGHGGPNNWTNEQIFHVRDIQTMFNKAMAFWMTATCNFSRFDVVSESGGELLLTKADGGAIALLSAARTVYSSGNYRLNSKLSEFLFQKEKGQHLRLGDIVRKAKNKTGALVNKMTFFLFGDPALMLHYPDRYSVTTKTIDHKIVSGNDTINALGEVFIDGEIVDSDNKVVSDFNGYVHLSVFDKEEEVKTLVNEPLFWNTPFKYKDRPNSLFMGKASVKNGKFTISFRVPKDIKYYYGKGRFVYYAADETNGYDANGSFENFFVGGESTSYKPENQGPKIDLYLNVPTFRSGDEVNETPLLIANVEDESGINIVGSGIGHDIVMRMNDDPLTETVLNDYYESEFGNYRKGLVSYKMSQLSEGIHSLFFRVWDLQNNSSSVTTYFKVVKGLKPVIYALHCYPNPASDVIYFVYEHDRPDQMLNIQVQVYDFEGRMVWQSKRDVASFHSKTDPVAWDLKNENGQRVHSGVYILKMLISTDNGEKVSVSSKIFVKGQ